MMLWGGALLTGVLSWWLTRQLVGEQCPLSVLDHPNQRSLHAAPTPRTGGVALLGSAAAGVVLAWLTGWAGGSEWRWIMAGVALLAVTSIWDDRAGLHPAVRLAVHGIAALGVVYGAGLVVTSVPIPALGVVTLGGLASPLTVLGVMWMTNLYNFMDGIDGFAGGMTVIGFGALGCLAAAASMFDLAVVSWLVVAAAIGFLWWNWPPARIFMGDTGSIPLGFLAGTFIVMGIIRGGWDLWTGLLLFAPFVVDGCVTLLRRGLRGARVWEAHREHYYQRLVLAGWSHRQTVLAEYVLMLTSAVTAVLYIQSNETVRTGILLMSVGVYAGLAWAVRAVERQAWHRRGVGVKGVPQ